MDIKNYNREGSIMVKIDEVSIESIIHESVEKIFELSRWSSDYGRGRINIFLHSKHEVYISKSEYLKKEIKDITDNKE